MVNHKSNITDFNDYMQEARGEFLDNLMVNLFKGYKAASEKAFISYIWLKKNDYQEGQELSPETLMVYAENKYMTMKMSNLWNAPTKEEQEIMVLKQGSNQSSDVLGLAGTWTNICHSYNLCAPRFRGLIS